LRFFEIRGRSLATTVCRNGYRRYRGFGNLRYARTAKVFPWKFHGKTSESRQDYGAGVDSAAWGSFFPSVLNPGAVVETAEAASFKARLGFAPLAASSSFVGGIGVGPVDADVVTGTTSSFFSHAAKSAAPTRMQSNFFIV
jgi:hypothetical protein